jgi:tRNA threonylcarbamoyladenosine biosynthesis protein TsaB
MKILGIESATAVCAASVVENGGVLSERMLVEPHIHSEKMISLVDEALANAASTLQVLDAIAVSIGPGSFTGLRIGLSVAKGLAYALDKPIVPVPTLEALAANAIRQNFVDDSAGVICCLIDARRDEVYAACYRKNGEGLEEIIKTSSMHLEELKNLLHDEPRSIVVGDGAEKFHKYLKSMNSEGQVTCSFPPAPKSLCNASSVALLGEKKMKRGEHVDVTSLEPVYVKDFYTLVKTQRQEA